MIVQLTLVVLFCTSIAVASLGQFIVAVRDYGVGADHGAVAYLLWILEFVWLVFTGIWRSFPYGGRLAGAYLVCLVAIHCIAQFTLGATTSFIVLQMTCGIACLIFFTTLVQSAPDIWKLAVAFLAIIFLMAFTLLFLGTGALFGLSGYQSQSAGGSMSSIVLSFRGRRLLIITCTVSAHVAFSLILTVSLSLLFASLLQAQLLAALGVVIEKKRDKEKSRKDAETAAGQTALVPAQTQALVQPGQQIPAQTYVVQGPSAIAAGQPQEIGQIRPPGARQAPGKVSGRSLFTRRHRAEKPSGTSGKGSGVGFLESMANWMARRPALMTSDADVQQGHGVDSSAAQAAQPPPQDPPPHDESEDDG